MKNKIITVLLLIIAAIHLIPVSGSLGAAQLESLYGVAIDSPELDILMRHRAVLFGILGCFFIVAAFRQDYQAPAFIMAAASILTFFFLLFQNDTTSEAINRIALGDIVALICLVLALLLRYWSFISGKSKAAKGSTKAML